MHGAVGAVKGDLHAVKACLKKPAAQLRREKLTVGVQPCDKPLRRVHQRDEVVPKRRLAAGEGHLRHAGCAQFRQDLFPRLRGQLLRLPHPLPGGIAVKAFLIAVPRAVFFHGADHKIHSVGRGHIRRIFAQGQRRHLRRRLLAPRHRHEAFQHQGKVFVQPAARRAGIDAPGAAHRAAADTVPVRLTDLPSGKGLHLIHKAGEQNRPAQIHGQQLRAVEQQ